MGHSGGVDGNGVSSLHSPSSLVYEEGGAVRPWISPFSSGRGGRRRTSTQRIVHVYVPGVTHNDVPGVTHNDVSGVTQNDVSGVTHDVPEVTRSPRGRRLRTSRS